MRALTFILVLATFASARAGGFSVGVNYPWHQENGSHLYGALFGELTDARRAAIERAFSEMREDGLTVVRLWLLASGWRWPERAGGRFLPLPGAFIEDLRWYLRAAHRHGLKVQPSIWDFHINRKNRAYVEDPALADELVRTVVTPLVKALSGEPGLYGWDVMNEPEWITKGKDESSARERDLPPDLGEDHPLATMRHFVKLHVDAIHAAGGRATVGSANAKWAHLWSGLALDEYQVHFYPPVGAGFLGDAAFRFLLPAVDRLKLDRPCVLGEFPPNRKGTDLVDVLSIIKAKGYAGAWAWSYFGEGFPEDLSHPFSYRARRSQFRAFTHAQ